MIAYLSGGMENAKDEGSDWRIKMTKWFSIMFFFRLRKQKNVIWTVWLHGHNMIFIYLK